MTFFEIDPTVETLARDTRFFRYLDDCGEGASIEIGDARRTVAKAPDGHFDMIMLDALSSDAIPAHLLTREALRSTSVSSPTGDAGGSHYQHLRRFRAGPSGTRRGGGLGRTRATTQTAVRGLRKRERAASADSRLEMGGHGAETSGLRGAERRPGLAAAIAPHRTIRLDRRLCRCPRRAHLDARPGTAASGAGAEERIDRRLVHRRFDPGFLSGRHRPPKRPESAEGHEPGEPGQEQ